MSDAKQAPDRSASHAPDVIETERLVGRRLTPADEPLFLAFHRDPRVVAWLGGGEEEITEQENREWLDEKLRHWELHGFGLYAWFARGRTRRASVAGRPPGAASPAADAGRRPAAAPPHRPGRHPAGRS